jgi:hypothetical protein
MESSPSWETNRCPATQEIPCILWNPKVRYHVNKNSPLVPILSEMDPVHTPILLHEVQYFCLLSLFASILTRKQFYFAVSILKDMAHGIPDNNLESLCI